MTPGLVPDDQFPQVGPRSTTNEWVELQNRDSLENFLDTNACPSHLELVQVFQYAIEVVANFGRKFYASQSADRSTGQFSGCRSC